MALTGFLKGLPGQLKGAIGAIGGALRIGTAVDRVVETVSRVFRDVAAINPAVVQRTVERIAESTIPPPRLQFLKRTARPDPSRMPIAMHDLVTNFSFSVRMTGVFAGTTDERSWWQTVISDDLLTREEIENIALETAESDAGRYPFERITATLMEGIRNERFAV